ncbi:MAG: ABC transporter permease, partial [Pseudomonadota bacterium]
MIKIAAPLLSAIALLLGWEYAVAAWDIKPFILPAPSAIGAAFLSAAADLDSAALQTLKITWISLAVAVVLSLALALAFSAVRLLELTFYPYAVILQVTPVLAVAPLIIIWVGVDNITLTLVIIATLVAFFPLLTTLIQGLRSIDKSQ